MAWLLTALLKQDETVASLANERGADSSGGMSHAQENWDNEGGASRASIRVLDQTVQSQHTHNPS